MTVDLCEEGINYMLRELEEFTRKFEQLVVIYDNNPSLEDRVRDTGILSQYQAKDLGMVGIVARASGLNLDIRRQKPSSPYDVIAPRVSVQQAGDVNARVWVRIDGIRESVRLLREMLCHLPVGEIRGVFVPPEPCASGLAFVEGWHGEIATGFSPEGLER